MIPLQERIVDTFSSFKSSNINKLTRIITGGRNCILRNQFLSIDIVPGVDNDSTKLKIYNGFVVKDDVLIEIKELNGYAFLDMADPDSYYNGEMFNDNDEFYIPQIGDDSKGRAYVVLHYVFQELSTPPVAHLYVLKDVDRYINDHNFRKSFLFLGMINFVDPIHLLGRVLDEDISLPINMRFIARRDVVNFYESYNDDKAREAEKAKDILQHLPAGNIGGYDMNRVLVTGGLDDDIPGQLKLVPFYYVASYVNNVQVTISGANLNTLQSVTIQHPYKCKPHVQIYQKVFDPDLNDSVFEQYFPVKIIYYSTNDSFTVYFNKDGEYLIVY